MDFGKRQLASEKEAVPCRSSSWDERLPEEAASKRVRPITAWQSYECCKQVPMNFGGLLADLLWSNVGEESSELPATITYSQKNSVEVLKEKVLTLSAELLRIFRVPGELVRCLQVQRNVTLLHRSKTPEN